VCFHVALSDDAAKKGPQPLLQSRGDKPLTFFGTEDAMKIRR
jgi:hypothetical protein